MHPRISVSQIQFPVKTLPIYFNKVNDEKFLKYISFSFNLNEP